MKKHIIVSTILVAAALLVAPTAAGATECVPSEAYTIEHEAVYETVVDVPEHTIEHEAVTEQRLVTAEQTIVHPEVTEQQLVSAEVPYQAAVYETEYEFRHKLLFWKTNWSTNPNWNAEDNDHSLGWYATGETRQGALISAEVPYQAAVYITVVVTAAWTEVIPAVYETVIITEAWTETVPATYKDVLVTEAWTEYIDAVECPVDEEPVVEEPVVEEPVVEEPAVIALVAADPDEVLAQTGGPDMTAMLVVGGIVIAAGTAAVAVARRRASRR